MFDVHGDVYVQPQDGYVQPQKWATGTINEDDDYSPYSKVPKNEFRSNPLGTKLI